MAGFFWKIAQKYILMLMLLNIIDSEIVGQKEEQTCDD